MLRRLPLFTDLSDVELAQIAEGVSRLYATRLYSVFLWRHCFSTENRRRSRVENDHTRFGNYVCHPTLLDITESAWTSADKSPCRTAAAPLNVHF
jgi:hypothetical protein